MRSKCLCWLRGGVGGQFPSNLLFINDLFFFLAGEGVGSISFCHCFQELFLETIAMVTSIFLIIFVQENRGPCRGAIFFLPPCLLPCVSVIHNSACWGCRTSAAIDSSCCHGVITTPTHPPPPLSPPTMVVIQSMAQFAIRTLCAFWPLHWK